MLLTCLSTAKQHEVRQDYPSTYIATVYTTVTTLVPCPTSYITDTATVTRCSTCSCTYCAVFDPEGNCCPSTTIPGPSCLFCANFDPESNCCPSSTISSTPAGCTSCANYDPEENCCISQQALVAMTYPAAASVYPWTTYTSGSYVIVQVSTAEIQAATDGSVLVSAAYAEVSVIWLFTWIFTSLAIAFVAIAL
jgi:hypothetical protein